MSTQYTLTVVNDSTLNGSVCVYQKDPEQGKYENLYSLAWFSKFCHPGTQLKFKWSIDYSFVWSETGILKPGVSFEASQALPADPQNPAKNAIGFIKAGGAYEFANPTRPGIPGQLQIQTDATIPCNDVAIGIGMSGQPTFAIGGTPNFTYSFIPHPEYWIAFGKFEEGEVIDLNQVSTTAQVVFPVNVYAQTLVFNKDNTWSKAKTLRECNQSKLALIK